MRHAIPRPARRPSRLRLVLMGALLTAFPQFSGTAQAAAADVPAGAGPTIGYARAADLVTGSSAIAIVRVRSLAPVPPERAPGLPAGQVRYYVEADTTGLIRGNSAIARRISFLLDLPAASGRRPNLKKRSFLLFGRIGERVDFFQLQSSTAMIDWTAANEALVRGIVTEALAPDSPPAITGISSAFHVTGAIQGEGETQVFLETANNAPISLSIIRRPDEKPLLAAALGEVVDDTAGFPARDTLLWYRLACELPRSLPAAAMDGLALPDMDAARRDYAAFLEALGPCNRIGTPPS